MTASQENKAAPTSASVTVIVPACNQGRFIGEALDSIFDQSVQPEQIVIVDDGSTDDTQQVVGRYTDRRIEYIRQPHAGIASARNTGLNAARCEYVTFLDAGDRWGPSFIERMHGFLDDDPTVACAFCNFAHLRSSTGELLHDQFRFYPELRRPTLLRDVPHAFGRIPRERAFSALVACADIPGHAQAMMFRRSLIAAERFDPSLASGEDTHFALRAFLLGGVIFTDEVLLIVRRPEHGTADAGEVAAHNLNGLKALAPHVTRTVDLAAYRDRLVRAHLDAAVSQMESGRVRAGLRTYRDAFRVPGSPMRKLKGSMRVALKLPRTLRN